MPRVEAICSLGSHITKCVNYHSLIMEVGEFKEIGMIVRYILCNSDQRCFTHSRFHSLRICDVLNIQYILSRGVSVLWHIIFFFLVLL
jgi:hypothetical protein